MKRILESGDYDNADQMARAIVSETYAQLFERDWWLVGARTDGFQMSYGFFATESAAAKGAASVASPEWRQVGVFPVRSIARSWARQDLLDDEAEARGSRPRCSCGHAHWDHVRVEMAACGREGCGCGGMRR